MSARRNLNRRCRLITVQGRRRVSPGAARGFKGMRTQRREDAKRSGVDFKAPCVFRSLSQVEMQ